MYILLGIFFWRQLYFTRAKMDFWRRINIPNAAAYWCCEEEFDAFYNGKIAATSATTPSGGLQLSDAFAHKLDAQIECLYSAIRLSDRRFAQITHFIADLEHRLRDALNTHSLTLSPFGMCYICAKS